jgi:hypothetical protein
MDLSRGLGDVYKRQLQDLKVIKETRALLVLLVLKVFLV